jgi:hypothetical protein
MHGEAIKMAAEELLAVKEFGMRWIYYIFSQGYCVSGASAK